MDKKKHIFLVGAKNIGAYGGYETFVDKLTEYHQNKDIVQYHIACKANGSGLMDETRLEGVTVISDSEFIYHNAHCFKVTISEKLGSAQALSYDIKSLEKCCEIIERDKIENAIIYIMACRIGIVIDKYVKKIHKLGAKVYVNPDGHEWMRAKWNKFTRMYWKYSEARMVKAVDRVICDSKKIEEYVHESYDSKKKIIDTDYVAYGAEIRKSSLADDEPMFIDWLKKRNLRVGDYYLIIGRFVPENNYEIIIREFLKSKTERKLAVVTGIDPDRLVTLDKKYNFIADGRVRFVGTVYNQELLMKIRENAFAYFHGHSVGGTNPSLLEALSSSKLNLLYDVKFNREVAGNSALYWNKENGNLCQLINDVDNWNSSTINEFGVLAKKRIQDAYSWEYIAKRYAEIFDI